MNVLTGNEKETSAPKGRSNKSKFRHWDDCLFSFSSPDGAFSPPEQEESGDLEVCTPSTEKKRVSMKSNFEKLPGSTFRKATGFFQFLGGASLLIGIYVDELIIISSLGLTILMFMGVGVRLKIKDSLLKTMPAIFYAIVNALIFYLSI